MMPMMIRTTPMIPAGFISSLNPASARHEVDHQNNDREYKQDMNESAERVGAHQAEQPEHEQNNKYGPQHNISSDSGLLLLSSRTSQPRLYLEKNITPGFSSSWA